MNEYILRLLELLKAYNGGNVSVLLEDEFKVFADTESYQIETVKDLVEAMEIEASYFEE